MVPSENASLMNPIFCVDIFIFGSPSKIEGEVANSSGMMFCHQNVLPKTAKVAKRNQFDAGRSSIGRAPVAFPSDKLEGTATETGGGQL